MAGNLGGGGSGIQNYGFTVLDEFRRRFSNPRLLAVMQRCLQTQWVVLTGFHPPDRAAMGANRDALRSQSIEVGARGYGGDRKFLDQIPNGDLASLFDQIQSSSTPLLRQKTRVLEIGRASCRERV